MLFGQKSTPTGSIFFSSSNDNGQNFSNQINLNTNSFGGNPQISYVDNNVYVVWVEQGFRLQFASSNDGGQTFGTIKNLSNSTAFSQSARVAAK